MPYQLGDAPTGHHNEGATWIHSPFNIFNFRTCLFHMAILD